ncbi:hypothetical protein B296_00001776 [Ensete ventricosum]|uniref:Uncharacterized protein n=1 Tax=Ensete ventricosum TaxID=4639 RepID=A0A427BA83_ENSVE|nr:hypothetical protein B296_00001776 [Ensete ventricosum]
MGGAPGLPCRADTKTKGEDRLRLETKIAYLMTKSPFLQLLPFGANLQADDDDAALIAPLGSLRPSFSHDPGGGEAGRGWREETASGGLVPLELLIGEQTRMEKRKRPRIRVRLFRPVHERGGLLCRQDRLPWRPRRPLLLLRVRGTSPSPIPVFVVF